MLPALAIAASLGLAVKPQPARHNVFDRRSILANAAATFAVGIPGAALASAGDGSMPKEEVIRIAKERLTPFQQAISLSAATERSFSGQTTNGYGYGGKDYSKKGTFKGAISDAPLFDMSTKYDSGTGWPSFYAAVDGAVIERPDPEDFARCGKQNRCIRTEVLDAKSGAHLGHVFPDGPAPTGKRYCMNAGALSFSK